MNVLDNIFSHEYPRKNGLIERFDLVGNRIIVESENPEVTPTHIDGLTFPSKKALAGTIYSLPNDSRSLWYTLRLIKKPENTFDIGKLLGVKLALTEKAFGGIPNDTILPRYTTFSRESPDSRDFGGVDMRLLPPYSNIEGSLGDYQRIITADCIKIGGGAVANTGFFLNAVSIGKSSVS